MKHWKSGFCFIDRWAIPGAMVWRHPDAAIDDPRPAAGSFNMDYAYHLSAHVIKLKDMPEGVLVLSRLSHVWKSRVCDPVLRGANGNVMSIHDFSAYPSRPVLRILPLVPLVPRLLQRLKLLRSERPLSSVTSSHLARRTRSALAQSSGSTTRPSSFVDDDDESDDDDDACVEIPLVTPLRSAAVISSSENHASSPSPSLSPSWIRVPLEALIPIVDPKSWIYLFPFSAGPYYATYPEDGVAGNCEFTREEWDAPYRPTFGVLTKEVFKDPAICKTIVDQFPTPREMVRVESLSDDHLTGKISVLYCMMMSHSGELLARYRGLNQSHHEYVLSTDYRLKVQGEGEGEEEKIKSLTKSLDNLHTEVARLFAALNKATILEAERDGEILRLKTTPPEVNSFLWMLVLDLSVDRLAEASPLVAQTDYAFLNKIFKHDAEPLSVILQLEPGKLVCPANVPTPRDARVSPPVAKESTVTPVSKSLELSANFDLTASVVASEHNEEMVSMSVVFDDVVELAGVGSGRVSSGLNDVVVALSASEKGAGLTPSSVAGEEAGVNPSGFRLSFSPFFSFFPLFFASLFSVKGGAHGMPENTCCSELEAN
ncbi:hypothetical protein Tco_0352574 [Tanacetum coccineum]